MSLYHKYRPILFKHVFGQESAVKLLGAKLKNGGVPKAILLAGPSGVGKTTLARIIAAKVGCNKETDFREINASESRGIDMVRSLSYESQMGPLGGSKARVYILDEIQSLTKDGQSALLKLLEDGPKYAYFMLCTTDPDKLLKTILTRCMRINLKVLKPADIKLVLERVCTGENITLDAKLIEAIITAADGSAREAVQLLEKAKDYSTLEEQLDAVNKPKSEQDAFELVKLMLWAKPKWADIQKVLNNLDDGLELERFRQAVLTCARKELLKEKGNFTRAHLIITAFRYPWFDAKRAGLDAACYEVSIQ